MYTKRERERSAGDLWEWFAYHHQENPRRGQFKSGSNDPFFSQALRSSLSGLLIDWTFYRIFSLVCFLVRQLVHVQPLD